MQHLFPNYINIIFLSVPQILSCLLASLILLQVSPWPSKARIAAFTAVMAPLSFMIAWRTSYCDIQIVHFLICGLVITGLVSLFLAPNRNETLRISAWLITIYCIHTILSQLLLAQFLPDSVILMEAEPDLLLKTVWPLSAAFVTAAIIFRITPPGKAFVSYSVFSPRLEVTLVIVTLLVQYSLLMGCTEDYVIHYASNQTVIDGAYVALACIIYFLSMQLIFINAVQLSNEVDFHRKQSALAEQVQQMVIGCQAQRHDFVNHVQTVNALLYSECRDELIEYLLALKNEYGAFNSILQAGNPVISSFLNSRAVAAREQGLTLDLNISTSLDRPGIIEHGVQIAQLLGAMLDIAGQALNELAAGERWLIMDIMYKEPCYLFSLCNPLAGSPDGQPEDVAESRHAAFNSWMLLNMAPLKETAGKLGARLEFRVESGLVMAMSLSYPDP